MNFLPYLIFPEPWRFSRRYCLMSSDPSRSGVSNLVCRLKFLFQSQYRLLTQNPLWTNLVTAACPLPSILIASPTSKDAVLFFKWHMNTCIHYMIDLYNIFFSELALWTLKQYCYIVCDKTCSPPRQSKTMLRTELSFW